MAAGASDHRKSPARAGDLGHDGTHFTLSHARGWNDFLTNLFAFWPIGLTVSGYRALHFKHHKHTGTDMTPNWGTNAPAAHSGLAGKTGAAF